MNNTPFENWCYPRLLDISWVDHVTNIETLRRIIGELSIDILKGLKRRKVAFAAQILRGSRQQPDS